MKALLLAVCFIAFPVAAAEQLLTTAQQIESAKSSPTLKAWNKKERERAPQNPGYRMNGPQDLCAAMRSVGLGCSYNERVELAQYLSAQGVDLFPCEGGTNPYTRDMCGKMHDADGWADSFYNFIGRPAQNAMLKKSIEKNRTLFRNGDLTAHDAGRWRK